jgi:hypothetical protein
MFKVCMLTVISLLGYALAAAAELTYTCQSNSDCQLVNSYEQPRAKGQPGLTLIHCRPIAKPLDQGQWVATEYNDYTKSKCFCSRTHVCELGE